MNNHKMSMKMIHFWQMIKKNQMVEYLHNYKEKKKILKVIMKVLKINMNSGIDQIYQEKNKNVNIWFQNFCMFYLIF